MSFSYDLTSSIGLVKLEIGDVSESAGVKPDGSAFSDEELTAILSGEGDVVGRAAARCCEILARTYARFVDVTAGPRKESLSQAATAYRQQAEALREQYGYGSAATSGILAAGRDDGFAQECVTNDYT